MADLVFMERNDDALAAQEQLDVELDFAEARGEDVQPLAGPERLDAAGRVRFREREQDVARILLVEARGERHGRDSPSGEFCM
jgi:hypothetical protein